MTSPLRRKHRITRSNIPQTVTASLPVVSTGRHRAARTGPVEQTTGRVLRFFCATALGFLSATSAPADEPFPTLKPEAVEYQQNSPVSADAERTLRQSRELMRALRAGRATQARPATRTEDAVRPSAQKALVPPPPPIPVTASRPITAAEGDDVWLTGGEESGAGIVTIPSLLPLPPDETASEPWSDAGKAVVDQPVRQSDNGADSPAAKGTGSSIQRFFGTGGHVNNRSARKRAAKAKRRSSGFGGWLIERYDPELERFNPDDYHMPVLLVGASNDSRADESADNETEGDLADSAEGGSEQLQSGLLSRNLTDIQPTLNYAWGDWEASELPEDFHERMDHGPYVEAVAPRTVLQWAPTNLWYHPLYFQDVGLERYGHTSKPWIQPFISSGRFFGQVIGLPYQMTLHPPMSREFALGYYQPGEWAPKKRYRVPFNEEAAATEFLWVTGLILLIP